MIRVSYHIPARTRVVETETGEKNFSRLLGMRNMSAALGATLASKNVAVYVSNGSMAAAAWKVSIIWCRRFSF